jgi:hypothetical protein
VAKLSYDDELYTPKREIRRQNILGSAPRIHVTRKTKLISVGLVIVGLFACCTHVFPFTGCCAFHFYIIDSRIGSFNPVTLG